MRYLGVEYSQKRSAERKDQYRRNDGTAHGQDRTYFYGIPDPVKLFSSMILTDKAHHRLTE